MTREETPYRYQSQCQECNRDYTSTVEYTEYRAMYGDYISIADYTVPAYCPTCREQPGNSKHDRREVHLSFGAELTAIGWIMRLLDRLEHPKDPTPPQAEQVEIFLDMVAELEDPSTGEFDVEGFHDRDAAPFYYAYCRLDKGHFNELCTRALEEYQVQVKGLAYRGEQYMRENGLIEEMEVEPKRCPQGYDIVPHVDLLDQMGTYIGVLCHHTEVTDDGHEYKVDEVIFDGEPIPHVAYTPSSTDDLTWGYGGAGPANTARSILEHAITVSEDPPDVDPAAAWRDLRGFDAYREPEPHNSGEIITYDEVMEFLRQHENESED